MAVKFSEFQFFSDVDKLEIDCMSVLPDGPIKGVVQMVHGMCEHKERYYDFLEYLANQGYLCVIHDHRGHGGSVESDADLGYFYDGGYEALVEDIHQLTMIVKEEMNIQNVPYILIGHSMGSLAARCYLKQYDSGIDKLIVLGSPSKPAGTLLGLGAALLMKKIKGGHAHSGVLDYLVIHSQYEKRFEDEKMLHAWICSDPAVVEQYNRDPHCNFCFTVDGYIQLIRLTQQTYSTKGWEMQRPDLPILFLSGKDDPCNRNPKQFGKSVRFLKKRGYKNVKAVLYRGMRHEILNEKDKKRVYKHIYDFISSED